MAGQRKRGRMTKNFTDLKTHAFDEDKSASPTIGRGLILACTCADPEKGGPTLTFFLADGMERIEVPLKVGYLRKWRLAGLPIMAHH